MLLYLIKPYSLYKLDFLYKNEYRYRPKCWIVSLFVYLNLVLLSINSYFRVCIKPLFFSIWLDNLFYSNPSLQDLKLSRKTQGFNRIGPHNIDVLSIIFGSLLGKGEAEKMKDGTRINFNHKSMHLNYPLALHNFLFTVGYCDHSNTSNISKELGKKGKHYKTMNFYTWTYTSFDWIYDMWYKNNVKTVPQSIGEYLTPLAIAIWVMDRGVKVSSGGLSFSNYFTLSECELLARALHHSFELKVNIFNKGIPFQYSIHIPKESMVCLKKKIGSYVIPSMKYKLLD